MQNKCRVYGVISLLIGILLIIGCQQQPAQQTREVTDLLGRTVEVPQQIERVVAVGPGSLRLVTHLEAVDKVVGVEEAEQRKNWGGPYNLAHPEFQGLPVIGPPHGGDAELIIAQNPDLIFFYGDAAAANSLEQKTGVPVVGVKYVDLGPSREEYLYQSWELIGELLNKEERAKELINYTESLITDLKQRTADIDSQEKKRVYAGGISYHGAHGIVSTKVPFPPFEFLNLNYFSKQQQVKKVASVMISKEKLVDWNPEVIFVDQMNLNLIKQDLEQQEYQNITAVEQNQMYGLLPYSFYHRNPATILANTYYMGQIIYPQQFSDINAAHKADEIYKQFVGAEVYQELKANYGGFQKMELNIN
ncbi:MAG: iron ABC transporter substrate-binding protein [Bacillota bacterium]